MVDCSGMRIRSPVEDGHRGYSARIGLPRGGGEGEGIFQVCGEGLCFQNIRVTVKRGGGWREIRQGTETEESLHGCSLCLEIEYACKGDNSADKLPYVRTYSTTITKVLGLTFSYII